MNQAVSTLTSLLGPLADLLGDAALPTLPAETLLQFTVLAEEAGRCIDSLRVQAAAEVADRSRPGLGSDGLSSQKQCANGMELLANLTRAPRTVLAKRMRLGSFTHPELSLTGEWLPRRFPYLAEALDSGRLGMDAARVIANTLIDATVLSPLVLEHAEGIMVSRALGDAYRKEPAGIPCTFEETENAAAAWRAILDPDGVEPTEERAMKQRCVSKGVNRNGLVNYHLQLMPEIAGSFEALLDAYLSPRTQVGFPSAEEQAAMSARAAAAADETLDGNEPPADDDVDRRTHTQKRHDTLAGIFSEAARSDNVPHLGGDHPTVLVTIREEDLLSGRGAGWVDGIGLPVSAKTVQQMVCTGGLQRVVIRADGKLVKLGTKQREFSSSQRRAISARDGGCIIPGCTVPARRTEVHHVQEHSKGGPTNCLNGALLCWYHHRTIDTSGWQIQMRDGVPWIKGPPWLNGYTGPNPWRRAAGSRTLMADRLRTELDIDLAG